MNVFRGFLFVIVLFSGFSKAAFAVEALVTPEWILASIGKPGIVFLDVRHPGAFARGTVPGAVNTNYGRGWRVKRKGVPGLLPTKKQLEKLIGGLGISNSDHVVILPGGYNASEMGVATRIYWTFKVSGHTQVSILDGGMEGYFALNKKAVVGAGNTTPGRASFTVTLKPELLATEDDVRKAQSSGQPLIDYRPSGQFLGINNGGAPKRPGTLKTAVNIPAQWLTVDDGGSFRKPGALAKLYEAMGVKSSGPVINFCNIGHWASVGWFVTHELMGNAQARLYDGSMAEWTNDPKNPVERKVSLD